jgi:hypothetical protein
MENDQPRLEPFSMERTGIEPVTSGLQILSSVDQPWSADVESRWLRSLRLGHLSLVGDDGQRDLTRI